MPNETWTIYCHTHIGSGRRYVGLTRLSMMRRWKGHVAKSQSLKPHGKSRSHFANAIRQYGKDAFTHEVLETCSTIEEANQAEIKWIENYDSTNPEKGYNIKPGGNQTPHPVDNNWQKSPEYIEHITGVSKRLWTDPAFIAKQSEALRLARQDPEVRKKASAGQKGKVLSPEHRAKISGSSRSADDDVRARITEAVNRPEAKEKYQASIKEYWSKEESRIKAKSASKSVHIRPEVKEKLSQHILSEDSKKKIAETIKSRHMTDTHKICKKHGSVPLGICRKERTRTGFKYRCGLCIMGRVDKPKHLRKTRSKDLTEDQILKECDEHYKTTGSWPSKADKSQPKWKRYDEALRLGYRGLISGSSLYLLLKRHHRFRDLSVSFP
jgi:hypothetical protein